jgi:phage terminase large subunit-like protein
VSADWGAPLSRDEQLKLLKQKKLEVLKAEADMRENLPHLYGHKHYKWSREFFESTNKMLFLTSANQVGKSSISIRKIIHFATEPKLWPKLWPTRPLMFWYLYPSLKVSTIEVKKKWEPEFLPRGPMRTHPQYGWRFENEGDVINAIHFNTGVSIYFKSYMTNETLLQTGSVHYLAFDEEMPEKLWPEIVMRVAGTSGNIVGVFTPTLSQQFWYDVMERRGQMTERFKTAHKLTVSLYDSQKYEDGTASHWTKERITQIINSLPSDDEIQRRVYGRFIISRAGLKYPSFTRSRNVKPAKDVPKDWLWFCGIDSGSGGYNHPAAICFIAVNPEMNHGRVVEAWRGDRESLQDLGIEFTTTGDILEQYLKMKGTREVISTRYDWADKDMATLSERNSLFFEKADKSHERGEGMLNTLFKNCMLDIDDTPMNQGLINELLSLKNETKKTKAVDDSIDSCRYIITSIQWDMSNISDKYVIKVKDTEVSEEQAAFDSVQRQIHQARNEYKQQDETQSLIEEWNEYYGY